MLISKWEGWLYDWWLTLTANQQWNVRIAFCFLWSVLPGAIHHYQSGPFGRRPEPSTIVAVLIGCLLTIIFSILWTRSAKVIDSLKKSNERLTETIKELAVANEKLDDANNRQVSANKELAEMNEELAGWNIEKEEIHQQLLESQNLLREAYTQLKVKSKELELSNNYDSLTGLHSRRYYDDNKSYLEAEARRHGWYFWAILLDVNKLKDVNDTLGHEAGDDLLRFFAEKLKRLVRKTDLCARLGGDEFCILGIDQTNEVAEDLVANILKDMDSWFMKIKGISLTIKVSVSVGCYSVKLDSECVETVDSVIKIADQRMYEHKNSQGINGDEPDQA